MSKHYAQQAKAGLEKRAMLVHKAQVIAADPTLSAELRKERVDKLNVEIEAVSEEVRSLVDQGEREAEVRALSAGFDFSTGTRTENRDGVWLATELRQVVGSGGLGAATTPPEHAGFWFDRLAPQSAFLASGVNVLRTERDSLVIPRLLSDPVAAWTDEATLIGAADPSGDSVTATPRKIATRTEISNEVIADSEPKALAVVEKSLLRSVALKFDLGAFEGTGTAPEIRGLKNTTGIQNVSMGTNGAALTSLDPFADALGGLDQANAQGSAIVMHPRTWQSLIKLKDETGSVRPLLSESSTIGASGAVVRRLYGIPVFLTSALSITEAHGTATNASSAYVYDASQLFAVLRKDAEVALDPYSLFSKDMSQVRVTARADVVVANPAAVVRIAGITG